MISQATRAGRNFSASTGRLTLTAAGNVRAIIQNPAGSGERVILYQMTGLATGLAWANVYINPTVGVPATAARSNSNQSIGNPGASAAIMRVDQDALTALSGGTDTQLVIGVPSGARWELSLFMVIPPGVTMGLNIPFAGAADAVMTAYWIKESI